MANATASSYWGEPPTHPSHMYDQQLQQQQAQQAYASISHSVPQAPFHNGQSHSQTQTQGQHNTHQHQQLPQLQLEHHMRYDMADGGVTMMNNGAPVMNTLHQHQTIPHSHAMAHTHAHPQAVHQQRVSPPIPAAAPPQTASGLATSLADERGVQYAAPADAFVFGPGAGRVVHPATMAGEHPSAFPVQFPDSAGTGSSSSGSALGTSSSSVATGSSSGGASGRGNVFNAAFSFAATHPGAPTTVDTGIAPHQTSQQAAQQQQLLHPNYTSPTSPSLAGPSHFSGHATHQSQSQAYKRRRGDEPAVQTSPAMGSNLSHDGDESDGDDGNDYDGSDAYGAMMHGGMMGYGTAGGVGMGMQGVGGVMSHGGYGQPGMGMGPGQGGDQGEQKRIGGACTRCRSLKVRCEFTTDPHKCRRCLNGGHECLIPGRKKRKQPPKREFLLSQIRQQAEEIDRLMKLLQISGQSNQSSGSSQAAPKNEPSLNALLSPSTSPLTATDTNQPSSAQSQSVPLPDVQQWIARARESIQEAVGGLGQALQEEADLRGHEGETGDGVDDGEEGVEEEGDEEYEFVVESGEEGSASGEALEVPDTDDGASSNAGGSARVGSDDGHGASQYTPRASPSASVRARTLSRESSLQPNGGRPSAKSSASAPAAIPKPAPQLPLSPAIPFGLFSQMGRVQTSLSTHRPRSPGGHSQGRSSRENSEEPMHEYPSGEGNENAGNVPTSPRQGAAEANGGESGAASATETGGAEEEAGYGAAAPEFFTARRKSVPDPTRLAPARHPEPFILTRGVVTPDEVEGLFEVYFTYMNLSCSLLDPYIYTAKKTYWRSPFLFTVICAIASRFYPKARKGLYEELMNYAQLAAGTALISGPKTVETVSAYILLSLYPVPMRRWEEDRTWLYLGLAIRVATDINLHHPNTTKPRGEWHAREILNRTRVWLNCHNLDRSTASWHGKSSTIANTDYVATHSGDWYKQSQYNLDNFDIHISCYNAELRVVADFKRQIYSDPSHPTGLNKSLDITKLSSDTDEHLRALKAEWDERLKETVDMNDPQGRFRSRLIGLAYSYSRLVVLSFGFQHAFGKGRDDEQEFFNRCYRAALDVVQVFNEDLSSQKVYLRHGPEAQAVFVTFASAFLIKLLHPKYAKYLTLDQRKEIRSSVEGIVELLSSSEVVNDEKHGPKLWANFLSGLMATPMAKVELSPSALKGGRSLPRRSKKANRSSTGGRGETPDSPASVGSPASPSPSSSGDQFINDVGIGMNSSPAGAAVTLSPPQSVLPMVAEQDRHPATSGHSPLIGYDLSGASYTGQPQPPSNKKRVSFNTGAGQNITPIQTNGYGHSELSNALQMNVPEFFNPPLAFDTDFLQSMNTMEDPTVWQNMPGFNWMGILQNSDDMQIDSIDPGMLSNNNSQY